MIGSCVACVCRFMDTRGSFGEHVRSVRLTRGVAESSSCFSPSFKYVHNSIYAQLKALPILLEHSMQTQVTHEQRVYYNSVGFTGNRFIPKNYDKAKTTKKYCEAKSLFKELKIFCSEAKSELGYCMYETAYV